MPDLFINWDVLLSPLYARYGSRRHPLWCANRYQLLVKVLLSAQDSDSHINALSPSFFTAFPSMHELSTASEQDILGCIRSVRNHANKARWLKEIAEMIQEDENIPHDLVSLTALPGIGRKSANVIIRESGGTAEGIIVDLHVQRVAPRLRISFAKRPEKIENEMMELIPPANWDKAGMALSFLGREVCRPTGPLCGGCPVKAVCGWEKKRL